MPGVTSTAVSCRPARSRRASATSSLRRRRRRNTRRRFSHRAPFAVAPGGPPSATMAGVGAPSASSFAAAARLHRPGPPRWGRASIPPLVARPLVAPRPSTAAARSAPPERETSASSSPEAPENRPRSRAPRRRATRRGAPPDDAALEAQRRRMDALRRSARPTPTTTPPPAPDGFDLFTGEHLGAFPPRGRKNRTADRAKTPARSPPARSPPRGRLGRPSSRQTAASAAAEGPRRGGRRIESSSARRPRASSPSSPPPSFDGAIVVEGANDRAAVLRAVRPSRGVILLKGAYDARSGHHVVPADVTRDVVQLCADAVDVVVLTDSDVAGRQLRSRLVQDAPLCLHAFIGTHLSSAAEDTEWHRAGNVGVEHAAPEAIRDAVAARRAAHSAGGSSGISRDEFSRSDLERWGLCGPLGESAPDPRWRAFGGVATRRRLVGERLGVGDCDAKQLTRQLNLFFAREEAEAAVAALPEEGEAAPAKMTDGGADRAAGDFREEGEGELDIFAYLAPGEAPPGFR